jgi:hypothetical protein
VAGVSVSARLASALRRHSRIRSRLPASLVLRDPRDGSPGTAPTCVVPCGRRSPSGTTEGTETRCANYRATNARQGRQAERKPAEGQPVPSFARGLCFPSLGVILRRRSERPQHALAVGARGRVQCSVQLQCAARTRIVGGKWRLFRADGTTLFSLFAAVFVAAAAVLEQTGMSRGRRTRRWQVVAVATPYRRNLGG